MQVKRFEDAKPYEAPNHRGVVGLRLQGFKPAVRPTNGSAIRNSCREAGRGRIRRLSRRFTSCSADA